MPALDHATSTSSTARLGRPDMRKRLGATARDSEADNRPKVCTSAERSAAPALVLGRPCDSPGCAASANPPRRSRGGHPSRTSARPPSWSTTWEAQWAKTTTTGTGALRRSHRDRARGAAARRRALPNANRRRALAPTRPRGPSQRCDHGLDLVGGSHEVPVDRRLPRANTRYASRQRSNGAKFASSLLGR